MDADRSLSMHEGTSPRRMAESRSDNVGYIFFARTRTGWNVCCVYWCVDGWKKVELSVCVSARMFFREDMAVGHGGMIISLRPRADGRSA